MLMSCGIRFHLLKNKDVKNVCDICGLEDKELIISNQFDNGNSSPTQICFCRSCVRNLDNIFEV